LATANAKVNIKVIDFNTANEEVIPYFLTGNVNSSMKRGLDDKIILKH
jgi:hypothetical protein